FLDFFPSDGEKWSCSVLHFSSLCLSCSPFARAMWTLSSIPIIPLISSDATKTTRRYRIGKHLRNSITKLPRKSHLSKKLIPLDASKTGPYVSPPFSMAPYDSLPPISSPDNTSPYCVYPPFIPQPPSPPASSTLPGPTPIPPSSPNPPTDIPTPAQPVLSPPYYEPSPPSSEPGPPNNTPSPRFLPPIVYPPPSVPPPRQRGPSTAMWCVAKAAVPEPIILEAMNFACGSGADCNQIQPSGPCFEPNTVLAHASYAFNSYFQRTKVSGGTCDFGGTALLVTVDPIWGKE
ncbi:carbohydrate-binding X8 domain superfamily protein, partial [Striga asiatica]